MGMRISVGAVFAFFCIMVNLNAALATEDKLSLRGKIQQSLESLVSTEAQGIENCGNKCDKAFNRFAYAISTSGSQNTYEFRACVMGCERCNSDLLTPGMENGQCFRYCKDFDWQAEGILKGVIEPDKACIGGCLINTCQVICAGGTTESTITRQNRQYFYPNGGCSIKTQPYSQNLEYVNWNSPNTGQGGSASVAQCCSNALSLCEYVGNQNSTNYRNLLQVTQRSCNSFVSPTTQESICAFQNVPQNCGSRP